MFTCMKFNAIRPWLLNIVDFLLVDSVTCRALGLHEGCFGSQPTTSLVDENSTWQV